MEVRSLYDMMAAEMEHKRVFLQREWEKLALVVKSMLVMDRSHEAKLLRAFREMGRGG